MFHFTCNHGLTLYRTHKRPHATTYRCWAVMPTFHFCDLWLQTRFWAEKSRKLGRGNGIWPHGHSWSMAFGTRQRELINRDIFKKKLLSPQSGKTARLELGRQRELWLLTIKRIKKWRITVTTVTGTLYKHRSQAWISHQEMITEKVHV